MKLISFKHLVSNIKKSKSKKANSSPLLRPMMKMLTFVFILFGSIFGYKFIKALIMPHPPIPPVSVSATFVKTQEWDSKMRSVGTLRAIQGVDITTELPGMVKIIHFTPGSQVKANDILVELNTDVEVAQRDSLLATTKLAEITYERDKAQYAVRAISKAALDFSKADLDSKKAQLAQQEATVAKKIIRAPFDGILGISKVNLGQYLNTGDKIVTLQRLDPIFADFSLPQQTVRSLKTGQKVRLKVDTYTDDFFTGKITSIDPKIDVATRNVQVEATLTNPDHKLYPGMFGELEIYTGTIQKALTLPKIAISFNPFGEIVYIIQETGKDKAGKPILTVKQTFVTVGESTNEHCVILKGIKEGDQIVTAGQLKLKNGTVVTINNSVSTDIDTLQASKTDE